MIRAIIVVSALIALAACGQREEAFPPGTELTFMRACEARSQTDGLCGCVWDKIEAEVAPRDFIALERLPAAEREAHALTAQINNYAYACAAELAPEPSPAP